MSAFVPLLGETLTGKSGDVNTADALAGKTVALYFSAHWCPPCRGFTPKLAEIYKGLVADGKPFEVVFVSSDRDEASFNEYHGEQPWLALPFADRDAKAKLSKKFKVNGIPTLVILDADANTVTTDGRSAVMDPSAFPWVPPTPAELLSGPLLGKDGVTTTLAEAAKGKHVALYFSAHWCPPCRGFTPELAKTYEAMKAANKGLEIVFVSSDRDEGSFDEYFAEQPWLALPYAERKAKEQLSTLFGVQGIPSLVLLTPELELANANARGAVSKDPKGAEFPEGWLPKLVRDLDEGPDGINDTPSVVVLMEEAGDCWDEVEEELGALAGEAKASGDDVLFFVGKENGGIGAQIRKLCKLGKPGAQPEVVLLDLAEEGAFHVAPKDASGRALKALLNAHKVGGLAMDHIKR